MQASVADLEGFQGFPLKPPLCLTDLYLSITSIAKSGQMAEGLWVLWILLPGQSTRQWRSSSRKRVRGCCAHGKLTTPLIKGMKLRVPAFVVMNQDRNGFFY